LHLASPPPPAFTALSATHRHDHGTTFPQAARSLGLALVGVTTDRPAIAWASRELMGVALSFPAEMKNRILGLLNLFAYQASKMVAASFSQMAAAIPKT